MNILWIGGNSLTPDYMHDSVLHGFKELYGSSVVDANRQWYLYESEDLFNESKFESIRKPLHGWGLTYGGTLNNEQENCDRTDILSKIKNNFFDLIIIGICREDDYDKNVPYTSVYNWRRVLKLAIECVDKKKLVFIDGSDSNKCKAPNLLEHGHYFKRELVCEPKAIPISFAIPKQHFKGLSAKKTQVYSKKNVPAHCRKNYSCKTNEEYFKDYSESLFAFTCKKGGWDCFRHYEIIAAGCIPFFIDIENCPSETMKKMPKNALIKFKDFINKFSSISLDLNNGKAHLNEEELWWQYNSNSFFKNVLDNFTIFLYEYGTQNLTTESLAKYILCKTKTI